mmetsp:Transcript_35570/g.98466  ORF Transcript_35570/g.98466 Transcript_35570/m.98466 type:complete len:224 (-) Transcript_35570:1175-1846(-)
MSSAASSCDTLPGMLRTESSLPDSTTAAKPWMNSETEVLTPALWATSATLCSSLAMWEELVIFPGWSTRSARSPKTAAFWRRLKATKLSMISCTAWLLPRLSCMTCATTYAASAPLATAGISGSCPRNAVSCFWRAALVAGSRRSDSANCARLPPPWAPWASSASLSAAFGIWPGVWTSRTSSRTLSVARAAWLGIGAASSQGSNGEFTWEPRCISVTEPPRF